jgi:hypothetical protein
MVAATHAPFTQAGAMDAHWIGAGVGQAAQSVFAALLKLVWKFVAIALGSATLQTKAQALLSTRRVQSELLAQVVDSYLLSMLLRDIE